MRICGIEIKDQLNLDKNIDSLYDLYLLSAYALSFLVFGEGDRGRNGFLYLARERGMAF